MQKRYQYYGPKGVLMWTEWFTVRRKTGSRQMGILKNEYRNNPKAYSDEQDTIQ